MHVAEEVTEHLQTITDLFNDNEVVDSIPNLRILESFSVSNSATSTLLLSSIQTLSSLFVGEILSPFLSKLYHTLTSTSAPIPTTSVPHPMLSYTITETQSLKVPLPLPSFTFLSSPIPQRILVPSLSLQASNICIPSYETSIPTLFPTSEPTVVQYISSSLFTSHVTMPIPTPTITQISSLVSIENVTSSFTESVAKFEEDNVVPLGDYFYSKSSKEVVRKGNKRSIDQGGLEAPITNQIIWAQQSGDP